MRCAEFEHRLQELLDERVRPETDAGLCAHASQCAPCGKLLDSQELLFEGLAALPRPELMSDLTPQVLRELQTSPVSKSPGWDQSRMWFPWSVAAAILIAGAVLLSRSEPLRQPTLAQPAPTEGMSHGRAAAPPLPALAVNSSFHQEYVQIAHNTGETVALALRWPGLSIDNSAPVAGNDPSETPEWVEGVTNGIRPLTKSMGAALDALRNSIPGGLAKSG